MLEAGFVEDLILTIIVLLWAGWWKLDLGLRRPAFAGIWPWVALYLAWYAAEWVIFTYYPSEDGPDMRAWMEELGLAGSLILICVTGPIFEELLFRGALYSAMLRRWGIRTAIIVPSILWGLMHIGYEAWFIVSVAGSGVVLGMIRWKSRSLYVPLCLHMAGNLLVTLDNSGLLASRSN